MPIRFPAPPDFKKKFPFFLPLSVGLMACCNPVLAGADTTAHRPGRSGYGVSLQAGTTGVGAQLAWRLPTRPHLVVRAGLSNLFYQQTLHFTTGGTSKLLIQPNVIQNFALGSLKWHPFRSASFFLSAGGGYARHSALNLMIQAESKLKFGGLEVTPENVGTIDARFTWGRTLGYAGFGFCRSVPVHRLGFGLEIGCYYLGRPKIDLQYNGFLETTTIREQLPIIQRNLSGYRYLPSLQVALTYAIRR